MRGDALRLSGILVLGIDLDEQAIDIGRDAHIGAQLLRRHIHLQGINDLGGAQGAIEIGDMVVECLLDGLGQAKVAAAGHDEHLLGGAVDGVHALLKMKAAPAAMMASRSMIQPRRMRILA